VVCKCTVKATGGITEKNRDIMIFSSVIGGEGDQEGYWKLSNIFNKNRIHWMIHVVDLSLKDKLCCLQNPMHPSVII